MMNIFQVKVEEHIINESTRPETNVINDQTLRLAFTYLYRYYFLSFAVARRCSVHTMNLLQERGCEVRL